MRIHLDNVNLASRSGPNSFAKRFADCASSKGHTIFGSGEQAEVSLVFIERSGKTLAKRVVQRLDGIWFSPEQFYTHNTNIKSTYEMSDHVIWQSEFDKNMVTKWWSQPRGGTVVRNGCPQYEVSNVEVSKSLEGLRLKHEKIFVCSANWHPQKRLKENVRLFTHLKKSFYPTACLVVMGSMDASTIQGKDIYYTGSLPHEVCVQVFKESDWMIHLGWLDHCPNTVVETLSVRTPVICSEEGGTRELIGSFGLSLRENVRYEYQLTNYDDPPSIDVEQVNTQLPEKSDLKYDIDVSIETCVDKYISVLESVL